jgi:hypothetical protein
MSPREYKKFLTYKEAIPGNNEEEKKGKRKLRKMPPEYSFSTKDFKFNRDEANDYEKKWIQTKSQNPYFLKPP